MNLKGRHFLTLKDYTPEEILYLLDLSAEVKRKKKEIDKTISDLWNRIWDLQDQTNKIKKAVLTGEKGDLKMPERRIVPPDEPIPFGGTVDMDCIFEKEPCEQVDVEFSVKELLQMYTHYVDSLSTDTHVLAVISIIALIISIVALIV